jgi:hypothetical protein
VPGKLSIVGDASFNGRVDICGNFFAQYPAASIPSSAIIGGVGGGSSSTFATDISVNSLTVGRGKSNQAGSSAFGFEALFTTGTGASNTAFGYSALRSNTSGDSNTAVGWSTLDSNTSGVYNSAFGRTALDSNTTGSQNNSFGLQSLYNSNGTNNCAFGYNALFTNTSGGNNNAFGNDALRFNSTGTNNTAIGNTAGYDNKTGTYNTFLGANTDVDSSANTWSSSTAIGANALITASNQITLGVAATNVNVLGTINTLTVGLGGGSQNTNTAFGKFALSNNTTGGGNNAVGYATLNTNSTGTSNNGYGTQALKFNTTGGFNTAVGESALIINTTGSNNTAIGSYALYANSIGNFNAAIGERAGFYNKTGTYNTFLGANADVDSSGNTWSSSTAIGANALITASNQITLGVAATTVRVLGWVSVVGNVTASSHPVSSDYRIKDYVTSLSDCSFTIDKLRPVSYHNKVTDKPDIGLIAHEVQEHFPFLVSGEKDGDEIQSVNYTSLISLLIHEIQQLKQETIPKLNQTIKLLEDRVQILES